jgi:outer membrane protein OmpA-like peptidoglycan-associated protein
MVQRHPTTSSPDFTITDCAMRMTKKITKKTSQKTTRKTISFFTFSFFACSRASLLAYLLVCLSVMTFTSVSAQTRSASRPPGNGVFSPWRFGAVGEYGLNVHLVDFAELPESPLFAPRTALNLGPSNLRAQTRSGFGAALLAEYVFSPTLPTLALGLRLGYAAHDGSASTFESYPVGRVGMTSSLAGSTYRLATTLRAIYAEPMLVWKPFAERMEDGGMTLHLGTRIGTWLQASYTQRETLTFVVGSASGGFTPQTFEQERAAMSGAITSVQRLNAALVAGIGFDIPIQLSGAGAPRLFVSPEGSFAFALTDVAAGLPSLKDGALGAGGVWRAHQIKVGVSVKVQPFIPTITPNTQITPILPPPQKPTPAMKPEPVLKPVLAASLQVVARYADGKERSEAVFTSREVLASKSLCPLLPYVFFDNEANLRIPDRYALLSPRQVLAFDATKLNDGDVLKPNEHVYYHIMNIVAERMKRYPKAILTLTGCIDGASLNERGQTDIARMRAEAVRRYMLAAWGSRASNDKKALTPDRIIIEVKGEGIPLKASIPLDVRSNMVENRRVEMSSDTPELLAPLLLEEVRASVEAPALVVRPAVRAGAGKADVSRWRVVVRRGSEADAPIVKEWSGVGAVPEELVWDQISTDAVSSGAEQGASFFPNASHSNSSSPFSVEFVAIDAAERASTAVATLPTRFEAEQKRSAKKEFSPALLERYRLILFDFNSSDLTQSHRGTIDLVRSSVAATLATTLKTANNSSIAITGYTDRVGNEDGNKRLSLARARSTADALGILGIKVGQGKAGQSAVNISGNGSTPLLYDNDVPEGRFYCRTVIVQIVNR